MSAAAAVARLHSPSKRPPAIKKLTSVEASETVPELKARFTKVENGYFDILPSKVKSHMEFVAIGQVIRRSYGGVERLEWVPFSAKELAALTKSTIDGAEKALKDAVSQGFLEVRKLGNRKYYRVVLSAFEVPEDKEPRKLDRKPQTVEEKASPVEGRPGIYLKPGRRSEVIELASGFSARYRNESIFPINVAAEREEDGVLDIAVFVEQTGEKQAKSTRTGVRIEESEANENKERRYEKRDIGIARDFLLRWCRAKIPRPLSDEQIVEILDALGDLSRDRFAEQIRRWLPTVETAGWKDLADVARAMHGKRKDGSIPRSSPQAKPSSNGHKSKPKENGRATVLNGHENQASRIARATDGFENYMEAASVANLPASPEYWEEARQIWKGLSLSDQIAAVRGIWERIECGEFSDPAFLPRVTSYLKKRTWKLPLRPRPLSKSERTQIENSEQRERFFAWAAALDERRGIR